MRYRLKNVPLQTPAATAWLVRRLEERANDLLEVLAARRQNSEDVLLAPGELRVGDISPAGLRLRWPGSSRSYSLAPEFLPEIIRWLGMSAKDFVHALHESPTTLESRADGAFEERGDAWGGLFLRSEAEQVRAVLPGDYRPLDHLEVAAAFADECACRARQGFDIRMDVCDESLGDLTLAACSPSLAAEVREGDWLYAGISLSNSECTTAPLEVKPRIYRVLCANGAISQEAEVEGFEIGKVPSPAPSPDPPTPKPLINLLDEYKQRLSRAFDHAFLPDRVEHEASINRAAAASALVSPFEHLQHLVAQGLLTEDERDAAQRLFAESNEASLYGLANAVTAAAHGQRGADPHRAARLERLGAEIVRGDHGPPVGVPVWV